MRETGSGTLKSMETYLKGSATEDEISLNVIGRFGSSTAVKEGIKAGLGVSIISSIAIDMDLKTGMLSALRIENFPMFRDFYLIRDSRRAASPICGAMIEYLLDESRQFENADPI
jgi:DNA-binding transcriptional LysR family regulator